MDNYTKYGTVSQAIIYQRNERSTILVLEKNKIQSNLSYVTFQGNSEIWSPKIGGRLIQV
jgi:hypothetical protein